MAALLSMMASGGIARGKEWPKDYVVIDTTVSPDGRLGIAAPGRDEPDPKASDAGHDRVPDEDHTNYLVDPKTHQVLLKIEDVDYFEGANHQSLKAEWSDSLKWGVAYYDFRFGNGKLLLFRLTDGKWSSFDLAKKVGEVISAAVSIDSQPWLGADSNDTVVHVFSSGDDNPKAEEKPQINAGVFEGRYDMVQGKWLSAKARKISHEDDNLLEYGGRAGQPAEQWRAEMDRQLNGIYLRLKELMPGPRFEELKAAQREWVAASGKAGSPAKENVRLAIRLHELRDLLATTLVQAPGDAVPEVGWTEGYEVEKATVSPDGRLGIAVNRSKDAGSRQLNYLVDVKQHKVLAGIPGVTVDPEAGPRAITVDWADDGTWCVANYGGRQGFTELILLRLSEGQWTVTELGGHLTEAMSPLLKSEATPLHYWLGADSSGEVLHFHATGNADAKAAEGVKTRCAVFSGRYDLKKGEWLSSAAKTISRDDELDLFYEAHGDLPQESAAQWQARMDHQMNEVYASLKEHMIPDRFEEIQKQQREWSAGVGKAGSPAKESLRLATRLHELRDLLAQTLAGES